MVSVRRLSFLHPLRQRPQVARGDFDGFVLPRLRVEDALLLDVGPPRPAGVAQRVAAGVPESGLFAGADAASGHRAVGVYGCFGLSSTSLL